MPDITALLESAKSDIRGLLTSYPLYADMKRSAIAKINEAIKRMEEKDGR